MHSFRAVPGLKSPKLQAIFQRPIIFMPAVVFGSALLGIGLVCYLQPGSAEFLMHHGPWLRSMGFCLLAVAVGYVLFVVIYVKKHPAAPEGEGASDGTNHMAGAILGNPFFRRTLALTNRMMAPMMDKMLLNHYAPVFPQIHPDQAQLAQLRDLILKKNAVNMDKGLALMDRKLEAPRRAALIEEMKNGREACDAEIRQLLGEEDYRVFEQFEKSLPDRLILGLFKSKAARMGAPLTEQQQEQLLHVVSAARALYNWSTDLSRRVQNPTDLGATFSEENISTFAREEQEFDRQFVAEATPLLTAAQLAALEPFLAVQRQAIVSAMKMTAKMFAPGGS